MFEREESPRLICTREALKRSTVEVHIAQMQQGEIIGEEQPLSPEAHRWAERKEVIVEQSES